MRKSLAAATICASLAMASTGSAHGDHGVGAVGAALNIIEAIKHTAVIADQTFGEAEDRSLPVLMGNVMVVVGHLYQANLQTRKECCKSQTTAPTLVFMVLANAWNVFDLVVDGITTREYWQRNGSYLDQALKVLPPICMALNLYSFQKMWRRS